MKMKGRVKPIDEQNPGSELGDLFPPGMTLDQYRQHIAYLRELGPEGRLKRMMELNAQERQNRRAEIRARHPEYSEAQLRIAYIRLVHGEEIFRQFFPESEVEG